MLVEAMQVLKRLSQEVVMEEGLDVVEVVALMVVGAVEEEVDLLPEMEVVVDAVVAETMDLAGQACQHPVHV
ncbi:hypothetical protein L1987_15252 [Smallanthus sonchifolius]|uniref:Uncharacterized protein n=1 Tax=Smallanthus sonchifolius TaxID=185202 RepID=A0ACB9J5K0_9ASTR|nr:hypothetical protein L1987_15252 [Smallanthus sonchifolius]